MDTKGYPGTPRYTKGFNWILRDPKMDTKGSQGILRDTKGY